MRLNHIVFPIDFSESSQRLNREVEWLAKTFQAQVTLLHVFEIPTSWYSGLNPPLVGGDEMMRLEKAEAKKLRDYQINVPEAQLNRVLLRGGAAWQIIDWAEKHHVDMVVMGTRGLGRLSRMLVGSVAMNVLHEVSCPVWTETETVAKNASFGGIRHILCPVELMDEAVPLLRYVKELADKLGAQVHLTHSIVSGIAAGYQFVDAAFQQHMYEWAAGEIERRQEQAGTNFPITITAGSLEEDITKIAATDKTDLIVVGRGRAQKVLGSVRTHAYEIIRHAKCPVLSYSSHWKPEVPSAPKQKTEAVGATH